jgi:hypothetical protein
MKVKLTSRLFYTWMILTVAAFGMTGSQCARVGDRVTAADTSTLVEGLNRDYGKCISTCNLDAADARRAENQRFRRAIAACNNKACREQEIATHMANLEGIHADLQECKANCHQQGTGSGGE